MYAFVKPLSKGSLLCRLLTASAAAGLGMVGAIPLALQAQTNCAPVPSGLVSWWRAEGDGVDFVGTNNALLSGVGFIAGKVGQAFNFLNTTSNPVRIPASASLNVGSGAGLTIEGWIDPGSASIEQELFE